MPSYKLYYFPGRGRAEAARILFALAEKEYEDVRLAGENWQAKKKDMPFGQMPVLEVTDDAGKKTLLPQSGAIVRYLAREFKLEGKNHLDIAVGDAITEQLSDLMKKLNFVEKDEEKKKKHNQEAINGQIKEGLLVLEKFVNSHSLFVGDFITATEVIFSVGAEVLLQMEPTALDCTPKLKALNEKVKTEPKIAAWIAKRPKSTF